MSNDKKKEIAKLKEKARVIAVKHKDRERLYSIGAALAQYVDPEIDQLKKEFNQIMDELKKIDPSCPEWRML